MRVTVAAVATAALLALEPVGTGARFLLVQSDTRNLDTDISTAAYHSLTAVTNYLYAKQHDADYLYFVFNQSRPAFLSDAKRVYGAVFQNSSNEQSTEVSGTYEKKGPSAYHPVLRQFRAAPWTKLLALWNISQSAMAAAATGRYSHIFFLDSDAVVNPKFHRRSLYDALRDWSSAPCHVLHSRPPGVSASKAAAIFLDNSPFEPYDKFLCDGAFVLNLGFQGVSSDHHFAINRGHETGPAFISRFIKEWWDHDVESKDFTHWWRHLENTNRNFNHAYEQDSLWDQLYNSPRNSWRISENTVCVVAEPQFPPSRNDSLWVNHVGSPWEKDRGRILKTHLAELRVTEQDFARISQIITSTASVEGFAVDIAANMATCS